ncbi:hypothetical protein [Bradyrhizobium sp. UFLA05-112]
MTVERPITEPGRALTLCSQRKAASSPWIASRGSCEGDAVEFHRDGNDEMEPARGRGWAEELADGSLEGEICLEGGDDIPFIARRLATSSTAC